MRALVWFRSCLRTADHAALSAATRKATKGVVALFVISPAEWQAHDYAPVKVDLILRTLAELSDQLEMLNISLIVRTASTVADVPKVVVKAMNEFECHEVCFNREYEVNELARDAKVREVCEAAGATVREYTDQSLIEPGDVRTGEGRYYTVFTPFKRSAIAYLQNRGVSEYTAPKKQAELVGTPDKVPLKVKGFESNVPPNTWPAGEKHARKRLASFAKQSITSYKAQRDFPAIDGTSTLSPYLTIGAISPRQCVIAALEANHEFVKPGESAFDTGNEGCTCWISEVLWREFYIHILRGYPRVCKHRAFQTTTERVIWNENKKHLQAWQQGKTGVPIVDAGMRQLLTTGWMHNRVRMITAMYFSKNLFLNWRDGEKWFMQHLVDGFLASNNGGWQWSASTGTDSAPYFRIFNPVSQSIRFDPDGEYIRKYVPELANVEGETIHEPWTMPTIPRSRLNYPDPLVDLSKTRTKAIEAFAKLK